MATRRGGNRYPRPGDRIAPATLREVLLEPVPRHLVGGAGVAGLKLGDLDESVWDKLSPEAIAELADMVVERVAAGCARRKFHQRHFPRPPAGIKLAGLRLEHRTNLCLARDGFEKHPEILGDHTIGQILGILAFGPRCLVDLLSSLETLLAKDGRRYEDLTSEAKRLAELPEAPLVLSDDSRFGSLIHAVDVEAANAKDLADRLIARNLDPPDPLYATDRVRRLRERILALSNRTLEKELIEIFASTPHKRNREILVGYYGWKDGQSHTLAEIGARYGMTRERTRQICAKLVKREHPQAILAPVMDRTIAFVEKLLPAPVARLETEMSKARLTAVGLRLENVESAAKLLARPVPFTVVRVDGNKLAVRSQEANVPSAVVESAKKEVYYHGVATVGQIGKALSEKFGERIGPVLITETLQLIDGFRWLDKEAGWFRFLWARKHGLPRAIDKILAVAGRITVSDLRKALSRNRRMWQVSPPEKVILGFSRQMPGVRIEGNWIIADPPQSWKQVLTGVELHLVEILKEHGPMMERGALEDLCIASGMNRFSFHAFIASSPVIAQYGHSIYGLLGMNVSRRTVESLLARRRAERAPRRVLDGYGRTESGKIWLRHRLSKAASIHAVLTIPAALKNVVYGRFQLLSADGRHVGTLSAKHGRAWGLGAFLRQNGARIDDRVTIRFDVNARTAVIAIGEETS